MPIKRIFFVSLLLLSCVTTASAAFLRGNVILYPIEDATFRSEGYATYYNDLQHPESATMSGEHDVMKVSPGSSTFMVPVQGDGSYSYSLQGPTDPGACYGTTLHAIAIPANLPLSGQTQFEETWYGYTQQCDPRSPQPIRYYLSVWINVDGHVTQGSGNGYYDAGSTVVVGTSGSSEYHFDGWTGDVTSADLSTSVYMDGDKTVTANWTSSPSTPPDRDPQNANDNSGCPAFQNCNSPIIVNLGNGPYQLSGVSQPVSFDIDANGTRDRIGWTAAGAAMAFLALDRDSNEAIDSGAELFGNHTPLPGGVASNGFVALAQYDANSDGVIDASDPIWSSLLLWTDLNHDGVSQPSELALLSESAVTAVGLDYHWTGRRDQSGNTFRYQSSVWINRARKQPTPMPIYDVYFIPAR